MSYPFSCTFPKAAAGAVCAAQTRTGSGALLLNGTLSNASVLSSGNTFATVTFPNIQRTVSIFSTADLRGINFTVTGFDLQGAAATETIAGPNANATVETAVQFHIVTAASADATVGTAVSLGTGTVGATAWYVVDKLANPTDISIYVKATATVSYTVQQTPDDPNSVTSPATFNDLNLTAATGDGSTSYGAPCGGVRAIVNSSSTNGAIVFTATQAGF